MTVNKVSNIDDAKMKRLNGIESMLNTVKARMKDLGVTDDDSESNFSCMFSYIDIVRDRINDDSRKEPDQVRNYSESSFYNILSAIESMEDVSFVNGYYPTVDQLRIYRIDQNISKYLHMLLFYASDPFGRTNSEEKDEEEYKKLVRYCKSLTAEVSLRVC